MISIILVDDHPVVRDGLAGQIATQDDLELVGMAAGGHEALNMIDRLDPDLVITDLRMQAGDGVELIAQLYSRRVRIPVLVLTTYGTDEDLRPVLDAGSPSILLKDATRYELFDAIRATSRGEVVFTPTVTKLLLRHYQGTQELHEPAEPMLSRRELEILGHVADGQTNREIGRALHISEATVKTYLIRMYTKLEVSDRTAAVSAAYRRGLLSFERP